MIATHTVQLNVEYIRDLMAARGISQYRLAKETGLSKGQISKVLDGSVKNRDGTRIGTAQAIARTLTLPIGAIMQPLDSRWHRLDYADAAGYFRFLETFAGCRCLLSASGSADSFLLPDDVSEAIERERLDRSWIPDAMREDLLGCHRKTMVSRRRSRENGSHLHQIVAPTHVWAPAMQSAWAAQREMRERMVEFAERTAVAFIPGARWDDVVTEVASQTRFWNWSKVKIADDLMAAVWHDFVTYLTTDRPLIRQLRRTLETAAVESFSPSFPVFGDPHRSSHLIECNMRTLEIFDRVTAKC